jgi:hypothetical protein
MGMGKNLVDASMEKISAMENRLSGTLKPVAPRQEFVHGLARRIQGNSRAAFVKNVANWNFIALLIAGFVSLAVFLAMIARAILALSERKRSA